MNTLTARKIGISLSVLVLTLFGCHSASDNGADSKLTPAERDALTPAMRNNTNMSDAQKKAFARDQMRFQVQSGQRQAPGGQ